MKKKIEIVIKSLEGKILFSGNILDIPIKNDYIIQKSIEIFDDDDPCIIHQSFVIKKVADELLELTQLKEKRKINLLDFKNELHFLNLDDFNGVLVLGSEG